MYTKTTKDYIRHKELARKLVHDRLGFYNRIYGFKVNRVAIRNQKSRWGSCSTKGNLNFNYRIVKLPLELVDFVIVHELCHLEEFNHSRQFWSLVEKSIPDYKFRHKQLRAINLRGL